jgi:hypothetical protein
VPELHRERAGRQWHGIANAGEVLDLGFGPQQLLDSLLQANHGVDVPVAQLSLGPELSLLIPGGPAAIRLYYSPGQGQVRPAIEVLLPRGA